MFYCDARSYAELLFAENIPRYTPMFTPMREIAIERAEVGERGGKKGF